MMKIKIAIALLIVFLANQAQTQVCHTPRNPKAIRLAERGKSYLAQYPQKALKDLLESVKIEPSNAGANLMIATLYENQYYNAEKDKVATSELLSKRRLVEKFYKRAIKFCPQHEDYISYFHFGRFYYNIKQRALASSNLKHFVKNGKGLDELQEARRMIKGIEIYQYLKSHPVPFQPKAIKAACTDDDDEYLPLVSPDGKYLFFTRRSKRRIQAGNILLDEVFMFSEREAGKEFREGKFMPRPFNDGRNQGGATITIDNKTMFVTICSNVFFGNTAYKNCDIYVTQNVNGQWTKPKNLGEGVNGKHTFEAQPTISADGKTLYFVSIRDGGLGKMDIYKSTLNQYNEWTKAENLGPTINTAEDDKTPFIHTDNKTLYFASKGHLGMGGFDIFLSRKKSGKWSEPENIGYPINTEEDDLGMILTSSGNRMFFASRHLSKDEQYDLFSAELHEKARPEKVVFLKGNIEDEFGKNLPGADVNLENLKTQQVTEGMVDKKTGEYAVAVPTKKGDDYVMTVEKNNYIFRSHYVNPESSKFDSVSVVDFRVPKLKKGMTVQLENIYFEFNSSEFNYKSRVSLNNFLRFLKKNPDLKTHIYGHTDNVGNNAYNLKLSTDRAKAVFDYLVKHGIHKNRLSYKGFGETKPIVSNETDEGRAKNRRTEFAIF